MDVRLGPSGRRGLVIFLILPGESCRGHRHIALDQRVYDLLEGGSGILRIDLEELWRGRGHRQDGVSGGDRLAVQPEGVDRRGGWCDVEGMEMVEDLRVDMVMRRGNGDRRCFVDGFNLPVIYLQRGGIRARVPETRGSLAWGDCGWLGLRWTG